MSLFGLFGDGLNAITGVATSLINKHSQKETNKRQLEMMRESNEFNAGEALKNRNFQMDEAEKARLFNSSEAEKARQFQQQMYEDEKAYNSPSNQLKMMREAGLNPAGFDGPVASASAPQSPAVGSSSAHASGSSASSVSPPNLTSPSLANPRFDLSNQLIEEEIKNIRQNTEKQAQETLTIKELRAPQIEYQGVLIRQGESAVRLNEAEAEGAKANVQFLASQISLNKKREDEISASIQNLSQEAFSKALENEWAINTLADRIRAVSLDNQLKEDEHRKYVDVARQMYVDYLMAKKVNHQLGIQLWIDRQTSSLQVKSLQTAVGQAEFDFSQNKYYDDVSRCVNIGSQILNELVSIGTSVFLLKGAGKIMKGIGNAATRNTMKSFPGTNIPDIGSSTKLWQWH